MAATSVDLVVRVDISSFGSITNEDYAVQSDQVAQVHGEPISTLIGRIYFLPITVNSP